MSVRSIRHFQAPGELGATCTWMDPLSLNRWPQTHLSFPQRACPEPWILPQKSLEPGHTGPFRGVRKKAFDPFRSTPIFLSLLAKDGRSGPISLGKGCPLFLQFRKAPVPPVTGSLPGISCRVSSGGMAAPFFNLLKTPAGHRPVRAESSLTLNLCS